jgi:transcriptional regulator with GAF, ATPase, and Fis domain
VIIRALDQLGWVIGGPKGAAARLGLARTTLIEKMKKLGIIRPRLHINQNVLGTVPQQLDPNS